jgi:hypothetical protein
VVTTTTSAFGQLLDDLSWTSKSEGISHLFSSLIKARGDLKERIYEELSRLGEPEILLRVALNEYYKYGNEDRLTLAASLLADMGARALPVLRDLADSNLPEFKVFIPVIAYLRGISVRDRLEALASLAHNSSIDVRYSLLEALRAFTLHEAAPLLRTLSNDQDEDLAEAARARLASIRP